MDILAILGAVIAFAAILMGNSMEGGHFSALIDGPAFLIVMGGTLGAIVLQTPWSRLSRAGSLLVWVIKPPAQQAAQEELQKQAQPVGAGDATAPNPDAPAPLVDGFDENDPSTWGNPGRNEPCPCGSGKKFKHCHGRI